MSISGKLYDLLGNTNSGRFQGVVLNGQTSLWKPVLARDSQDSILGPFLFLIYINGLPNKLKTDVNLFADEASLFTKLKSANALNSYLTLIFNSDSSKPTQNMLFSRKRKVQIPPTITLNNIQMERESLKTLPSFTWWKVEL